MRIRTSAKNGRRSLAQARRRGSGGGCCCDGSYDWECGVERCSRSSEHRLKPVALDLCERPVFVDEKIFSGMHFFVACGDETCILRMRTHFTQRASENR